MPDAEDVQNARKLIKFGFYKAGDYSKDFDKRLEEVAKAKDADVVKHANIETMEFRKGEFIKTSYPDPFGRHVLSFIDPNFSVLEKAYMWIFGHITRDAGFTKTIKITDVFGSSVGTDHWAVMMDRLRNMQRNISETMQTVGVLVKDLFPMIHELHIWEERLGWHKRVEQGDKAADLALKGTWTDLVDGGSENAASVFGLAQKVGFATIPDLFFSTFVKDPKDVDEVVNGLDYANEQVKGILKRKLFQYLNWRVQSYKEIEARRRFTIRYLRQHVNAIRLNISWLHPYLKQLKYLNPNTKFQDSAVVLSNFDTSQYELETLFTKKNENKYKPVVLVNFQYVTTPERSGTTYQYSGFQHAGSLTMTFRGYVWTDAEIENYKKLRDDETIDMLNDLDAGFSAAMQELGDEISGYMKEAGEDVDKIETDLSSKIRRLEKTLENMENNVDVKKALKKERQQLQSVNMFEPFMDIGSSFAELFKMAVPFTLPKNKKNDFAKMNAESALKKTAKKQAMTAIKMSFINYRKGHKMITW